MITWHCFRICNHINYTVVSQVSTHVPRSFQGVNVAASIQTYGNYVPGKRPCGPKSWYVCLLRTVKAASADDCAEACNLKCLYVFSSITKNCQLYDRVINLERTWSHSQRISNLSFKMCSRKRSGRLATKKPKLLRILKSIDQWRIQREIQGCTWTPLWTAPSTTKEVYWLG